MQSLIGLLALLLFAVGSAAAVTLGSPASRRRFAAWLIASARAQEELRRSRLEIKATERERRENLLQQIQRDAEDSQELEAVEDAAKPQFERIIASGPGNR